MILATYDPIEYWVLIPKGIEIILFIVLAIKIRLLKNYTINKIYFTAFLLWACYIILNTVIFLFAANGMTEFKISLVMHKIAVSIVIIFAFLMFTACLVVKEGYLAFKQKTFYISLGLTVLVCILAFLSEEIMIVGADGLELKTLEEWDAAELVRVSVKITSLTAIVVVFPISIFGYSIIYLNRIISTKVSDNALKRQMRFMVWGNLLVAAGFLFFLLIQLFEVVNIFTGTLGHLIWTMAPIAIWKSQTSRGSQSEKKEENN